jgi:uncharacterized protein (DUF1778 family)
MHRHHTAEDANMAKKSKPETPKPEQPEPTPETKSTGGGFPLPQGGTLVFQHPAAKDFVAWTGPTVKELVDAKAQELISSESHKYKAITIRPKVEDLELLDEVAKLFHQSRNECACALLGAALREALQTLPDHIRGRVQMEAFKRLEWGVITPNGQVILPDNMFDKDGKLIERKSGQPSAATPTTDAPSKPDA